MRETLRMLDNSVEQGNITPNPEFSNFRIISENPANPHNFSAREKVFRGEFTHERARRAFEDYKILRDERAKEGRGVSLRRKLAETQKKGHVRDLRRIQDQIRLNEVAYNPQGNEVIFVCGSFEDARDRLTELIGPVETPNRHYRYERPLGDRTDKHETPPCDGFSSTVEFGHNGKTQLFKRRWRIDYDPKKGPHFNTYVNPGAPIAGGVLSDSDPESLNIALVFPGNQDTYEKHLQDIELYAITSMVNEDTTGHSLDYLGERKK